jgi:hypothetical protein
MVNLLKSPQQAQKKVMHMILKLPKKLQTIAAIKRKFYFFLWLNLIAFANYAQIQNMGMTDGKDSLEAGKVNISGYVDLYYGRSVNLPPTSDRPYAVSSSRNREISINLAYIDIRYQDEFVRARFTPAVGTYMNANYAAEPGTLKNIFEANAGVRISKKRNIWLDAGIIGSPFTNETAISKDQLLYTRSFAAENAPYYLSGARVSVPFGKNLTAYGYLINGWQQIDDVNNNLAIATQIEYRPSNSILINWNTYFGNEGSTAKPDFKNRYFTDLYAIFKPNKQVTLTADIYGGIQENKPDTLATSLLPWWQANAAIQYELNPKLSVAARIEYFEDLNQVILTPLNPAVNGFSTYSSSICFNWKINSKAWFRLEGRHYASPENVYFDQNKGHVPTDFLAIGSLCVSF